MFKLIKKIAINDFRLIFKDPTLWAFFTLVLLINAMVFWFFPYLISKYPVLNHYKSILMVFAVIENTALFCIINTLILVEEKETRTAMVYGVLPVSKPVLVISRLIIPYFLTIIFNLITLYVQPFYEIQILLCLLIASLAALIVPVYVLAISSVVKNRIEAMITIKLFNLLVLLPFIAFFVASKYQFLFLILPTHWLLQSLNFIFNQQDYLFTVIIYLGFLGFLLWLTMARFINTHFK